MTNEIEKTKAFEIAHKKVTEEKRKQDEELHRIPARNSRPLLAGIAFNLGLSSTEELQDIIQKDPKRFTQVQTLATKNIISYQEAEDCLKPQLPDESLIERVNSYQNSNKPRQPYPDEPGPPKIYVNPHKARGGMTKGKVNVIYEAWIKGGKRPKLDRLEKATPLDETPAFILF